MPTTSTTATNAKPRLSLPFSIPQKWWPILIGLAVSLILIVIALVMMFGGNDRDDTVDDYLQFRYMYEPSVGDRVLPDTMWTHLADKVGISKDTTIAHLEDFAEVYRMDQYGTKDLNLSHSIDDSDELEGTEADTFKQQLSDTYGVHLTDITEVSRLTVTVTIETAKGKVTQTTEDLTYVALEDGTTFIYEAYKAAEAMSRSALTYM